MIRTAIYQVIGTGYIEGKEDEDLRDLDLVVEVDSELCPKDPEVGFFSEYWSPSEEQAYDEARDEAFDLVFDLHKYDDFDVDVEFIEYV